MSNIHIYVCKPHRCIISHLFVSTYIYIYIMILYNVIFSVRNFSYLVKYLFHLQTWIAMPLRRI